MFEASFHALSIAAVIFAALSALFGECMVFTSTFRQWRADES
jgi:hypothetical protein